MANAINKVKMKLDGLALRNRNANYVNKDLYRMLYEEEMFVMAYETIRTNKGITTKGISNTGVDGISMEKIREIIASLRNGSFKPRPCRRSYILKPNGKKRPLGLPDFEEKLVQQCVARILGCIYDSPYKSTFVDKSHGFRRDRSCHTAFKQMKYSFRGVNYVIKADVKGFFDNVDHHVLINILRKRINDERFIQLIWKFLRAGIMVREKGQKKGNYTFQKTFSGTPQGGIISPVLSNIYLHEFDSFIENLSKEVYIKPTISLTYKRIINTIEKYKRKRDKYPPNSKEYKEYNALMRKTKNESLFSVDSRKTFDQERNLFGIEYIRYADDWMIGIRGTARQALETFNKCKVFFENYLKLQWNLDKSYVKKANALEHEFLGLNLKFVKPKGVKYRYVKKGGTKFLVRTCYKNSFSFQMPVDKVLAKLYQKGYLRIKNNEFRSEGYYRIQNQSDYDIALHYQSVCNGIKNYFRFVNNIHGLNYVLYLLCESFIKTLAAKHKSSVSKILAKHGKPITVKRADGKRAISIPYSPRLKRDTSAFSIGLGGKNWQTIFHKGLNHTSSYLKTDKCCICQSQDNLEMHHVKHIKRKELTYKGFDVVLGYINRKQIPVCFKCHRDIHYGTYDGVSPKVLADQIMANLGIKKYSDKSGKSKT